MVETAMRDADGRAVFVNEDGSYAGTFPREHIVRRADGSDSKFKVYGFVGEHGDFEEQEWDFESEDEAIEYATEIYGEESVDKFSRDGEVFEVEVHEVNPDE